MQESQQETLSTYYIRERICARIWEIQTLVLIKLKLINLIK